MSFIDYDDGYVVFEASDDDEEFESSDDDYEEFLWKALDEKQSAKSIRNKQADAFEREMNEELSHTLDNFCATNEMLGVRKALCADSAVKTPVSKSEKKFYDNVYFDSDEENEDEGTSNNGTSQKKKRKHPVISNDDLFYDPDMDKDDQEWVDRQRQSYRPTRSQGKTNSHQKRMTSSDAVLNCPACMTTLCLDCQRHASYKGQYRAMFVLSCKVDHSKTLTYPAVSDKKKKKFKRKKTSSADIQEMNEEAYHPVQCSICNTEVAVQDKDEVYHFFNVLSSFS